MQIINKQYNVSGVLFDGNSKPGELKRNSNIF